MKTNSKKLLNVSIRIVLLFSFAMLLSFIPDYLHSFFGDTFCIGNLKTDYCSEGFFRMNYTHGYVWHWGYRHWLFFLMGISLSIAQIVDFVTKF